MEKRDVSEDESEDKETAIQLTDQEKLAIDALDILAGDDDLFLPSFMQEDFPDLSSSVDELTRFFTAEINCGNIQRIPKDEGYTWIINNRKFINKGSYGSIYLSCYQEEGDECEYVIKIQDVEHSSISIGDLEAEVSYQNAVHNTFEDIRDASGWEGAPFVPYVYKTNVCMDHIFLLIMDRIYDHSIHTYVALSKQNIHVFNDAVSALNALFKAINSLHKSGFQHGDCSPTNFFYNVEYDQISIIDMTPNIAGRDPINDYGTMLFYIRHYYTVESADPTVIDMWFSMVIDKMRTGKDRTLRVIANHFDKRVSAGVSLFDIMNEIFLWYKRPIYRLFSHVKLYSLDVDQIGSTPIASPPKVKRSKIISPGE
jgi:hypothetical protein